MRPLRILLCTSDGRDAFNGINSWLLRFAPSLRSRGHDARVLLFPWSEPAECTTLPRLRAAGVPVDVIRRGRTTEGRVRACLRRARSWRPDIFVANAVMPALYAGAWLRSAGIPTVAVLHNDDAEYRAKIDVFAGNAEFFRISAVVAISQGILRLAAGAPAAIAVRCIPYGVPLAPGISRWSGAGPLRLVYHGRIVQAQKRIFETLEACVRVCRLFGVEADFFGSGPDFEAAAARLSMDDAGGRVRLRGRLDADRVLEALPAYHVTVLLSDYEGLGLSILEGMAAGLVPVCRLTDSGLPDVIVNGRNGLFVADRNESFTTAIGRLVNNPAEWQSLSRAARDTVASRFSPDAQLQAWEELWTNLQEGTRPLKPIVIPRRIALPPAHPALANDDPRYPGLARALWRRIRFPKVS